jgi:hypothetical protein
MGSPYQIPARAARASHGRARPFASGSDVSWKDAVRRRASATIRFALRPSFEMPRAPDRGLVVRLGVGYAILTAVGCGLSFGVVHRSPFVHPAPWIALPPFVAASASATIGVALAFAIVVATRFCVERTRWARRLHAELRPLACALSTRQVLVVGGLSSLGEEVLFRGFLAPIIGVLASSLVFGLAHQMRGPSRWVWMAWSTAGGLAFGTIFAATGSLVGAALAHGLANAANLYFLRAYDVD